MNVYDSLWFKGRPYTPNAPLPGLSPCQVSDRSFLARVRAADGRDTGARDGTQLDSKETKAWASASAGPVIIDIETREFKDGLKIKRREIRTDVRIAGVDGPAVREDAAYLIRVLRDARAATKRPVGIYDLLPSGFNIYNSVLSSDAGELARASASNDFLAATGLLAELDMLCPSLYTPYIKPEVWKRWAKWSFDECVRISSRATKPLLKIAFLNPVCGEKLVPIDFWTLMFQTCEELGFDGVVAWASSGTTMQDGALYIEVAQKFSKPKGISMGSLEAMALFPPIGHA
jgi:hypothetical protein